jgi:hypothetical protein
MKLLIALPVEVEMPVPIFHQHEPCNDFICRSARTRSADEKGRSEQQHGS